MKCHNVKAIALFMLDVLFVLKKVSLKFQEENSVLAGFALSIKMTIGQLNAMRSKDGPLLQKIKEFEITDVLFKSSTSRLQGQLKSGHYDPSMQRQNLLALFV